MTDTEWTHDPDSFASFSGRECFESIHNPDLMVPCDVCGVLLAHHLESDEGCDRAIERQRQGDQVRLAATATCEHCDVRLSLHPDNRPGPAACREAELRQRALDYR